MLALARAFPGPFALLAGLAFLTGALPAVFAVLVARLVEAVPEAVAGGSPPRMGTVLVSRRFSTVRMADLIVVLDRGRVVEVGSHAELIARRGLYAELFELQAQSYR